MANKILIVGNPNTGKSTLFNTLTKSNERVANFAGVTVKEKCKKIVHSGKLYEVVDLPGLYSFDEGRGKDELVTREFVERNKGALIVVVVTTLNLKSNFGVYLELIARGFKNLVVFVNNNGNCISKNDIASLCCACNNRVVFGDARRGRKKIINEVFACGQTQAKGFDVDKIRRELKLLNAVGVVEQKCDKIFLHKFWGKFVFLLVVLLSFSISFLWLGRWFSSLFETIWKGVGYQIVKLLLKTPLNFLCDYFNSVFVEGIGAVVSFLPQLFLMLICLYILEETGYLARGVYLFNTDLNHLSMNGKSIFSLMMGFSCTTSGYIATRNIDSKRCRNATSKMLPFIGCSAKLPIILFLTTNYLGGGVICLCLYLLVIVLGVATMQITKGCMSEPFIVEIPRLHLPLARSILKQSYSIIAEFFKRVVITLAFVSSIVWCLMNYSIQMGGESVSLLNYFIEKILFCFKPIGLDKTGIVVSLITGLVAKENILVSFTMFSDIASISKISLFSYAIFVLLYPPCLPALRCKAYEFGWVDMLKTFVYQMLIAYFTSFVFYTFASAINITFGLIMTFCASFGIGLLFRIAQTSAKNICLSCKKFA